MGFLPCLALYSFVFGLFLTLWRHDAEYRKNDIIIGSTNLKQEDVKAEPIGLYTRSTIDAENIKTEPIENNEDSVAYEKNIVEQDDIKNFEAKLKSERLTTPDLITTRKHKRNKQGTTLEIIEWGKPWGWGM